VVGERKLILTATNIPRMVYAGVLAAMLVAGSAGISQAADPHSSISSQLASISSRLSKIEAKVNHIKLTPGPMGRQGRTGPQGHTGPQGDLGPAGPQGSAGPQGLTGAAGPQGPQGPAGLAGATGPSGPSGPSGPTGPAAPTVLASGQTETGELALGFTAASANDRQGYGVQFRTPLAAPPAQVGIGLSVHCPGLGQATAGYLCVYGTSISGISSAATFSTSPSTSAADSDGFYFRVTAAQAGYVYWLGSYAYKAP
jgi:hypothetical protein